MCSTGIGNMKNINGKNPDRRWSYHWMEFNLGNI